MNDTIEIRHFPGVLISYDKDSSRFSVKSAETQCGYFVPRGDLVGDYRNFGEVLNQILDGCDQFVITVLDEAANSEIDLIWNTNIVLF